MKRNPNNLESKLYQASHAITQRNIALDLLSQLTPLSPEQADRLEQIERSIEEKKIKPLVEELNVTHRN